MNPSFRIFAFFCMTFLIAGCGGGGGGNSGGDDSSGDETPPEETAATTSLKMSLAEGDFWIFVWNYSSITFAQPNTTSTDTQHGRYTVTLGAPVSIGGSTAFPLTVTGEPDDYAPRWTHVAVGDDGSLLGSTNGTTLESVFNANTGEWTGGGFFIEFPDGEAVELADGQFDAEYNAASALVAGHSASDGGCETILDITLCSDTSTQFSEEEFYKEGVGPIGMLRHISYSSSGGGFFTSTQIDESIELIATSLSAEDGTEFNEPPWEEIAPLNVARSDHSAVALNGEIYVIGGFDGDDTLSSVEIYNSATNEWRFGDPLPDIGTGVHDAVTIDGKIYVHTGGDDVQVFDPGTGWATVTPTPVGAGSFGTDFGTYTDTTFGKIVAGILHVPVGETTMNAVGYAPATNQWLSGTGLPTAEWLTPAVSIIGDFMYVMGGFGEQGGDRGAMTRVERYGLATDTWSAAGDMTIARDNASAITLDGKIYVLGGNAVTCGIDCTVRETHRSGEVYDPDADSWSDMPAMFTARKSFDAVVLDGQIYAIGGHAGGGVRLADVERFTPP